MMQTRANVDHMSLRLIDMHGRIFGFDYQAAD